METLLILAIAIALDREVLALKIVDNQLTDVFIILNDNDTALGPAHIDIIPMIAAVCMLKILEHNYSGGCLSWHKGRPGIAEPQLGWREQARAARCLPALVSPSA